MIAPTSNLNIQRRLTELGRIRLGDKGTKGQPQKLTKFRLTSASRALLEAAARVYGGTVRSWQGAPDDGYWELYTETDALDIMVPPVMSAYSQLYEIWDAGGCTLRCDGAWESIGEEPCDHDHAPGALAPDGKEWRVTTRVSVILPKLPGLGTWRLETHGWNAAATLPASLDMLAAAGTRGWIPAILRLQQESSKKKVNGRSQTMRYVVPVIDVIGVTIAELLASGGADGGYVGPGSDEPQRVMPPGPSRPPRGTKVDRPELGPPPSLPERSDFRKPEAPRAPATRPAPTNGHAAPAMVSGWAVESETPTDAPGATDPDAPPDDTAPEVVAAADPGGGGEAQESQGLDQATFADRCRALRVTPAMALAAAKERWPDWDPHRDGALSPGQRLELITALETEKAEAALL